MTRFTSSSMQARAEDSLVRFRILAKIGVTSGYVYFCTGKEPISFGSNTYVPTAGLGEIEPIDEESDAFPRDIVLRLCGVNSLTATGSLSLFEPLRESMFGRKTSLYRQFLDATSGSVNTPELMWTGLNTRVEVRPGEGIYELQASSEVRRSAKVQYFNRETFRAVDSSDTFGDWMDQIALFKSQWGGNAVDFSGGKNFSPLHNAAIPSYKR